MKSPQNEKYQWLIMRMTSLLSLQLKWLNFGENNQLIKFWNPNMVSPFPGTFAVQQVSQDSLCGFHPTLLCFPPEQPSPGGSNASLCRHWLKLYAAVVDLLPSCPGGSDENTSVSLHSGNKRFDWRILQEAQLWHSKLKIWNNAWNNVFQLKKATEAILNYFTILTKLERQKLYWSVIIKLLNWNSLLVDPKESTNWGHWLRKS